MAVISNNKLKSLITLIPKNSQIKRHPLKLQQEIVTQILSGEAMTVILKRLHDEGYTDITKRQLERVKRHVTPMMLEYSTPQSFQDGELKKQVERMKMLLDEQYARLCEAFEQELEEKDLLKPNKFARIDLSNAIVSDGFRDLLDSYRDGSISDKDKNFLLSVMDRKGQDNSIDKKLSEFFKLFEQFTKLRLTLNEKGLTLDEPEKEDKDIFTVEEIDGFDGDSIGKNLRKKVIDAHKEKGKKDGQEET